MPHDAWVFLAWATVASVPAWFALDATLGRLVRWVHRPSASKDLPEEHLAAHYLILLKSARRCAYDLRHAAGELFMEGKDGPYQMYQDRAEAWLKIFAPDGIKEYRLELHREIDRLEWEIKALKEARDKDAR
jgi:hypothetical protein